MFGFVLCAGLFIYLHYTENGRVYLKKVHKFIDKIKMKYLMFRYNKVEPWFTEHKDHAFFKFFENASWFKWYGKRVVYVKPKDDDKLSNTEKDVKDAINAKDYDKALEIAKGLKGSPKVAALIQFLEGKVK